jgi:endonuclease YncB( thermonuclease family)
MSDFIVTEVVNGETFRIKNEWNWNGKCGDTIRSAGCDIPEKGEVGYEEAKKRLESLILNKKIEVKNAKTIDICGRLVADVYCENKNVADHFPEYKV